MAKRAKFALIFFTVLIIGWLVWSYTAHRRFETKINELIAHHEPVYYSDLDFSPIPKNQDAAFYYQSAISAMSNTVWPPASSNFTFPNYPPYPAMWHSMVDQAVAANQQTLALARRARNFDHADWGNRPPQSPQFPFPFRFFYFNDARALANLLGDAALQSHSHGKDAEALQRIFDTLHLADAVQQPGLLISRLVGIGIQALAVIRVEAMATDLQINPNRTQVIKLIHQLLDDDKVRYARQEVARYESVAILNDSIALASRATVLRPMIYLGAARIIDENAQFKLALAQQNWPAAQAIFGPMPPAAFNPDIPPRFSRFADLAFGVRSSWRYLDVEFRVLAESRMAAISLAANLYHVDHHSWPPDLKSLVPNYLLFVPDDPFYATPHPIGYTIVNGRRPMVFCDTDGIPALSSPPTTPSFGWSNNTGIRQWRDVTNWWQSPTAK